MAKDHTVAYVSRIPNCDLHKIHQYTEVPAVYDAKTSRAGQWASLCEVHFKSEGASLGLGKGQRYILGEPPTVSMEDRRKQAREAILANDFDAFEDACGDGDPMEFLEF